MTTKSTENIESIFTAADKFAAMDPRYKTTLFSYFTINERMIGFFNERRDDLLAKSVGVHPYGMAVGRVHSGNVPAMDVVLHGGIPRITATITQREFAIPEGMYLIAFSPILFNGATHEEGAARNGIAFAVGLIVALLGRACLLNHVMDHFVESGTLKQSFSSRALRAPQVPDGASITDGTIVSEALNAMRELSPDRRKAVSYAWALFGKAAQEADETFRFTLYWIALEVLGDTKGKGVPAKIGNAYGENAEFVLRNLEFMSIYELRHDVVHRGERVSLDARMERIMQGAFLDLWRFRLKLPCKQVLQGLLQHLAEVEELEPPGFDVEYVKATSGSA